MLDSSHPIPGPIVLFGSGETSPSGRKIFDTILQDLPRSPKIALLETPAGFELNSTQVIGRIGDFLSHRLQNYQPQTTIVHARKKNTPLSPDDPQVIDPLFSADMIFMGPGSPTYAVRQLKDSLAWYTLLARHRLGAAIALASAAVVAISAYALPVYEVYKVGEDIHWKPGLDLFGYYGVPLVFIPHWNNNDGGEELDTSRCFMGQERFARLMDMLPEEMTIIGLDEKTALVMDPSRCECYVSGLGKVTLIHTGHKHLIVDNLYSPIDNSLSFTGTEENLVEIAEHRGGHFHQYLNDQHFPMSEIGTFHPYHPEANLPPSIWNKALQVKELLAQEVLTTPPAEVMTLIHARDKARKINDWSKADKIRVTIKELGWEVLDTKDGPVYRKL